MAGDVVWGLFGRAGELKIGGGGMDRVGHRQTEIKEGKPNDLIYGSMSDSGDGGCHVKGGQMDREWKRFTTEQITGEKREEDR